MASSSSSQEGRGLIILGNSGVGKSFLANILLGREAFIHRFAARAVTTLTEFEEINMGNKAYAIFNIPGLIEADQQRIDMNKREIDKAFVERPMSLILYVFGQTGGRIKDEDIVAFNALNKAYPFDLESLVLVVNGLAKERDEDYEGEVIVLLEQLIKMPCRFVCFLDAIDKNNRDERQKLKNKLLQIIVERTPHSHIKKQDIEIESEGVRRAKEQINILQTAFQENKENYEKQIRAQKEVNDQMFAKIRNENELMQRLIERQTEEMLRIEKEHKTAMEKANEVAAEQKAKAEARIPPIWQWASNGHVPANAVVGGYISSSQDKLYVARFINELGQLAPGKLYPPHKVCYNGCCWRQFSSATYEVLTHPVWEKAFQWVPTTVGNLPAGAVQGGIASDYGTDPMYVCRGFVNGSLIPGKYHPGSGAYLPYGGKEHLVTSFEVLVWIAYQ